MSNPPELVVLVSAHLYSVRVTLQQLLKQLLSLVKVLRGACGRSIARDVGYQHCIAAVQAHECIHRAVRHCSAGNHGMCQVCMCSILTCRL